MAATAAAAQEQHLDMEGLLQPSAARFAPRRLSAVAAVAAALASAVATAGALALGARWGSPARAPLTVRALLASDELKDLTTDNLMALHDGSGLAAMGREHLREQVSRSFVRVDAALQQLQPEAHQQLDAIVLSEEQRASAMGVLRKLGDSRMVALGRAVSKAVGDNARDGGDRDALQRRLSGALTSRLGDLAQLNAEMFPAIAHMTADPSRVVTAGDMPLAARAATARRLAVLDGVSGGVNAHAQTLFESLEGQLGEKMPRAPARMLSMFGTSASSTNGATEAQGQQKFMDCVKAAVPDPTKVVKCIADNMSHVMKMVMDFVKGKSP